VPLDATRWPVASPLSSARGFLPARVPPRGTSRSSPFSRAILCWYELGYVETVSERGWTVWAEDDERARWRAAFYRGYGGDPFASDPERLRAYALVHALRSTEFSSVMAPTLAPALRDATVRGMRARARAARRVSRGRGWACA
jgi:hypothetical protein